MNKVELFCIRELLHHTRLSTKTNVCNGLTHDLLLQNRVLYAQTVLARNNCVFYAHKLQMV
jgi:hypothetical protein